MAAAHPLCWSLIDSTTRVGGGRAMCHAASVCDTSILI
jgi:hypothetical protein